MVKELNKKALPLILFLVFSSSILSSGMLVNLARANYIPGPALPNIRISSDGTINNNPSEASLVRIGDVYYLTGNLANFSLTIQRSNTVLDGSGYSLTGIGGYDNDGVTLSGVSNVTVKNMRIEKFYAGVRMNSSSNCTIVRNFLESNFYAIRNELGSANVFSENTIKSNRAGVCIKSSNSNVISRNEIAETVVQAFPVDEFYGAALGLVYAQNNSIYENIVFNNTAGVNLGSTSGQPPTTNNTIYHNNFMNNINQVAFAINLYTVVSPNSWDNCTEGNYWSNYNGTDVDGNGIGDVKLEFEANNTDNYPLMNPHSIIVPEFLPPSPIQTPSPNPTAVNGYTPNTTSPPTSQSPVISPSQNPTTSPSTSPNQTPLPSPTAPLLSLSPSFSAQPSTPLEFARDSANPFPWTNAAIIAVVGIVLVIGILLLRRARTRKA